MQNPDYLDKNADYYTREKAWLLPFVEEGPNVVMDLGCGSGRVGRRLLAEKRAVEMHGAEIFPGAAEEAAKIYKKVHVGDVEQIAWEYKTCFDYVICGDLLEHLKDPYEMVRRIFSWLKPGGRILVCVPNIRNFRVLKSLVFRGEWKYVDSGILDQTHLRFFTRRSCARMLTEAGFQVYHYHMVVYGPKKTFADRVSFGLFREFLATQVFCCGRKS